MNLELEEGDTTQWRISKKYGLSDKLPFGIAIQCELVGEGIQGNPLKITGQDIYCFNAYVIGSGRYLDFKDFVSLCDSIVVKTVPILDEHFTIPSNIDDMLDVAEGKSAINPNYEREGVVIRPKVEMLYNGSRLSFKAISNKYIEKCER
jgi:RNA ligase (TIGR02306 family)